jgi:hypothetical protein
VHGVRQGGDDTLTEEGSESVPAAVSKEAKFFSFQQQQPSLPQPQLPEDISPGGLFTEAFSSQLLLPEHGLDLMPKKGPSSCLTYSLLAALKFHTKSGDSETAVLELVFQVCVYICLLKR